MNEQVVVEVGRSIQDQQKQDAFTPAEVPPPNRRPRVREVSSRFMSPVVSSSSSGDLHILAAKSPKQHQRSNSVQRRRHQELEPLLSSAEENRPDKVRSSETPLGLQCKAPVTNSLRRQRTVKLFKENVGKGEEQHHLNARVKSSGRIAPSRPDTPMFSLASQSVRLKTQNNIAVVPQATAAVKLLQSSGMSSSSQPQNLGIQTTGEATSISMPMNSSSLGYDEDPVSSDSGSSNTTSSRNSYCNGSSIPSQNCNTRPLPELRSSMPEADMLPTVSTRNCNRGNAVGSESSKFYSSSPCSRSLNLPLSKPYTNFMKMGPGYLPPHPVYANAKKGRKVSSHQEDVHSLRLLHNHYLQWRYVNAKAEACMHAQRRETERIFHSLNVKISELCDSVRSKRTGLEQLQRLKNLFTVLEAQMPYLDEWSALEGDYSVSLSDAIQALVNTSVQLPVSGNVRAEAREIGEALNSAFKIMEMIAFHVQGFMPKAEEMDDLIIELARVAGGERSLTEECGGLLSKTYMSQVEECSLRAQLIQLHQFLSLQTLEE